MTTPESSALRPEQSGVYLVPRARATLRAAARREQFAWFDVDLRAVRDKAGFLRACARHLKFPPHFGANWDAFSDCQKPGRSARSSSSTCRSGVCITTSTETGSL